MGNGSVIVASFIQDFCPDFRIAHNPLCQWRKPGHAEFFVIIGGEKTLKANEELKKLMQTAVALHREGKLDAAEQLYRKYLAAWPPTTPMRGLTWAHSSADPWALPAQHRSAPQGPAQLASRLTAGRGKIVPGILNA
jgi:hypothetical protein